MEREFVNYNQALKLKALGFDEPCVAFYEESKRLSIGFNWLNEGGKNSNLQECTAPLYQQAFRWFRDTHNMFHEIQIDRTTEPKFCYAVFHYEHYGNYEEIRIGEWSLYRTFEAAESACLDSLIEIIQINTGEYYEIFKSE